MLRKILSWPDYKLLSGASITQFSIGESDHLSNQSSFKKVKNYEFCIISENLPLAALLMGSKCAWDRNMEYQLINANYGCPKELQILLIIIIDNWTTPTDWQ